MFRLNWEMSDRNSIGQYLIGMKASITIGQSLTYLAIEYLDQRLSPCLITCPFSMRLFSSR